MRQLLERIAQALWFVAMILAGAIFGWRISALAFGSTTREELRAFVDGVVVAYVLGPLVVQAIVRWMRWMHRRGQRG